MNRFVVLLFVMVILAACASSQVTAEQPTQVLNSTPTPMDDPALIPTLFLNPNGNHDLARLDEQGAVVFEVTPLNLGTPAATLDFDVSMNTHSVDLSMDLATLSTLSADTGVTVQASKWDAIPGGHHVSGTLIFPSMKDSKSILEGASKLRLTIVNADAGSRVFEWELK